MCTTLQKIKSPAGADASRMKPSKSYLLRVSYIA